MPTDELTSLHLHPSASTCRTNALNVCAQSSAELIIQLLSKGNISRRCDEQGNWQEMNISNCRRLTPKEAAEKGKQAANIPSEEKAS